MPPWLQAELDKLSPADQNHFYELIYPNHRLIDFWAEHPGSSLVLPWSDADWLGGRVQLNPILADNVEFRQNFAKAHEKKLEFAMNWPGSSYGRLTISAPQMAWLGSLLQGPTAVKALIEQAAQVNKLELEAAREEVLTYLAGLESFLFVMLDPAPVPGEGVFPIA